MSGLRKSSSRICCSHKQNYEQNEREDARFGVAFNALAAVYTKGLLVSGRASRCPRLLLFLLLLPALSFAITEAQFIEKVLAQDALLEEAQIGLDTQTKLHAIKQKLVILLDDQKILTEMAEFDLHKRIALITEKLPNYLRTHNRTLQRIALSIELKQIDIPITKTKILLR